MAGVDVGQASRSGPSSSDEYSPSEKWAARNTGKKNLSLKQVRTNEKRALTKLLNGVHDLMEDNTSPSVVKTYRPLILSQLRACELAHERYVESDEFEAPKKGAAEEYITVIQGEVQAAITSLESYLGEKLAEFVVRNTTLCSETSYDDDENLVSRQRAQYAARAMSADFTFKESDAQPTSFEQLTAQAVTKPDTNLSERGVAEVMSRAVDQQATVALTQSLGETSSRPARRSAEELRGELLQERWKNEHLNKLVIESGHKRQELANQVEQLERELRQREVAYRQQSERYDQERRVWQEEQSARMQALISRVDQIELSTQELRRPVTLASDLGARPRVNAFPSAVLETGGLSGVLSCVNPVAETRSAGSRPPTGAPPPQYSRQAYTCSNGLSSRTSTPVRSSTEVKSGCHQFSSLDDSVSLDCPKGMAFGELLNFRPSAFGTLSTQWLPKPTSSASVNGHSGGLNNNTSKGWPLKGEPPGLRETLNPLNHGHRSIFRHPKIDVEKYDGDPIKWPEFAAMFKDMVDSDPFLSLQGKLTLLKACLTPEVRSSIGECLSNPALYPEAVRQLERTYGHPDRIAMAHRQVIRDLPDVRNLKDFRSLRTLSNSLHGAVTALRGGGFDSELSANSLLDSVMEKIPDELRTEWGRLVYSAFPSRLSLVDFDSWLKDVVAAQMIVQPVTLVSKPTETKTSKCNKPVFKHSVYTTRPAESEEEVTLENPVVHRVTQAVKVTPKPECPLCKGEHTLSQCDPFKRVPINERALKVAELKCCFRCLKRGHLIRECYRKKRCEVQGCHKGHHTLLHGAPTVSKQNLEPDSSATVANVGTNRKTEHEENVLLAVVPITVTHGEKSVETYGLLDNGAETTLILRSLADELDLPGPIIPCRIGTFHGNDPVVDTSKVSFSIETRNRDQRFAVKSAYATPQIQLSSYKYNWPKSKLRWQHLSELEIPAIDSTKVRVLIGRNVRGVHSVFEERIAPDDDGPDAIRTPFGWCVVGPIPTRRDVQRPRVNLVRFETERDLENLWLEEQYGPDKRSVPMCESDKRGLDVLNRTIRHNGERYEVGLMLKTDAVSLPNTVHYAKAQFLALERQCVRNPAYGEKYHHTMQGYFNDGVAVPVTENETAVEGRVWYLPHHGVVSPAKPDKVRIVHNCSAVFQKVSLNDCLLRGPDLMANLFGVLLRFRHRYFAISGDIKAMFHQVGVIEQDQSLLRFLYRRPGSNDPIQVYKMVRHVFGAVSSPTTCIFALRRTAEDNRNLFPSVSNFAVDNTYVDNVLLSKDDEDELIDSFRQCKEVCARGGFSLVQIMANSRKALTQFAVTDLSKPLNVSCDPLPTEKILGLYLDWNSDNFVFQPIGVLSGPLTMRALLSVVSSIYDPLGFLSAVIINARVMLQDCWRLQLKWDDALPHRLEKVFVNWCQELTCLSNLRIPRSLRSLPDPSEVSLHSFSDASETAFGSAVYYRAVYPNGEISVRLIAAKARVAPIRQRSIPRLELQGAVQSLRIACNTLAELQFELVPEVTYWVDSQTVLEWIHSETCKYHAFVGHRITEILDASTSDQWRHVPGELNPADDATRGIRARDLNRQHRWFAGPPFLRQPRHLWPTQIALKEPSEMDPEVAPYRWVGLTRVTKLNVLFAYSQRESNWTKYVNVIGWLERYVNNRFKLGPIVRTKFLTSSEVKWARMRAIRFDQRNFFAAEIVTIQKGKPIHPSSPLLALTPFLDYQGLLRAEGRLERGPFGDMQKHPSLDAESFLNAFWRFAARRGIPREVGSDNGSNFLAGEKELKESLAALNSEHVGEQLAKRHVSWRFNPPAAPNFGGSWERLVRSAKSALRFILHDHKLSDEVLLTALVGVENLLNGRPLTHVAVDPKEPEPLTPFHFLLGRPNSNPIPDRFEEDKTGRRSSLKTWRHSQAIISHFWNRWLKEYVPELIERRKWLKESRNLKEDDIVLVVDPLTPRGEWNYGRVIEVYPGADGVVRTAKVKTKKGEYVRPTSKLCLLETEDEK